MGYLAEKLLHRFSPRCRERGKAYYLGGRVGSIAGSEDSVDATVRGTEVYMVRLSLEYGDLAMDCSCPYFKEHASCKHLWAVIMDAEQKGYLSNALQYKDIHAGVSQEHVDEHVELIRKLGSPFTVKPKPADHQRQMPRWKTAFASVMGSPKAPRFTGNPTTKARLLYLTDPEIIDERGILHISIYMQSIKKDGSYGKLKTPSYNINLLSLVDDEVDFQILGILKCSEQSRSYYSSYYGIAVPDKALDLLIPLLCKTGRYYVGDVLVDDYEPMSPGRDRVWDFRISISGNEKKKEYVVEGALVCDGVERMLSEPAAFLSQGWVIWSDCIERLNDYAAFTLLHTLKKYGRITVPFAQKDEFLKMLYQVPCLPPVTMPKEMRIEQVIGEPKPVFRIEKDRGSEFTETLSYMGEVFIKYDSIDIRPDQAQSSYCYLPDKRQVFLRDIKKEQACLSVLNELGLTFGNHYYDDRRLARISVRRFDEVVSKLAEAGWIVELKGKPLRKSGAINIAVTTGVDWFDLSGKINFGGVTAELPALLKAIQKKEEIIVLSDGSLGLLDDELRLKLKRYASLGHEEDGKIRFRSNQACILDAMLGDSKNVLYDEQFSARVRSLHKISEIKPMDNPAGLTGDLRPYQKEGLGWLHFLNKSGFGGCLADDMGLGKTIQVLALLESFRAAKTGVSGGRKPSLVVVPRSLIFNWKQEVLRFAPRLTVLDHTGLGRIKGRAHFEEYDIVLTTYGTMLRDIVHLKDTKFNLIVLDEAQAIKNADALTTKAVRLLNGENRLALSGTPVQNHLGELWSLFEFLNPGMLGASSAFGDFKVGGLSDGNGTIEIIRRALRPFILRRTKAQVAKDLPERTEETIYCELEGKQRKFYDDLKNYYRLALLGKIEKDGLNKSKIMVLEALLRLRQAACHPGLIDGKLLSGSSAKLDTLIPNIEEILEEGHKILVFSQFTSLLAIVRKALDGKKITYEYLDGKTTDREARVKRFQEDDNCKLFLISLKAGGLGLNLTAAEYVFLLDPWWNPAVEAQAIDRAHRIGQTRNVFAYRLIAKDTVEEKVLELQKSKRQLADSIINEDNSIIRNITKADIELLLC